MAIALAFAAALWVVGSLDALGEPLLRAAAAVAVGTIVTALAYGRATFFAVGIGALSTLVFAWIAMHSLGLAASLLCLCWMTPRFVLAESRGKLAFMAASSAALALVAGFTFASYADASWVIRAASCVFAGSCLSLACLLPIETAISFELRMAAAAIRTSTAPEALERAARAHRRASFPSVHWRSWRALLRLADQRAALEQAKNGKGDQARQDLDDRIAALADELAPRAKEPPGESGPLEPTPLAEEIPVDVSSEETSAEVSSGGHAHRPADPTAE